MCVPARSPAAGGAAAGGDALDDQPVVAGEREGAGEALGDGHGLDAEVGVLRRVPVRDQLRDDGS